MIKYHCSRIAIYEFCIVFDLECFVRMEEAKRIIHNWWARVEIFMYCPGKKALIWLNNRLSSSFLFQPKYSELFVCCPINKNLFMEIRHLSMYQFKILRKKKKHYVWHRHNSSSFAFALALNDKKWTPVSNANKKLKQKQKHSPSKMK